MNQLKVFFLLCTVVILAACSKSAEQALQGNSIEETLRLQVPHGSAWNKTTLRFSQDFHSDIECKFAPEASFASSSYSPATKLGREMQLQLVHKNGNPETGVYKLQCRGKTAGISNASDVHEVFFHSKLAADERCDLASEAKDNEFYFAKARAHLAVSGQFGAGSSLYQISPRIEFNIPVVSRKWVLGSTCSDAISDPLCHDPLLGNHRQGASADKYTGNAGIGFLRADDDYTMYDRATLRKALHFDDNRELLIIRKAWSYQGECTMWLRGIEILTDGVNYPYRFGTGRRYKAAGVQGIYAYVLNGRGQMIALNQAGDLLEEYESGFSLLRGNIIHGNYGVSDGSNPAVSHDWNDYVDPN